MATPTKRRSIVEFEKWLDKEIESVEKAIAATDKLVVDFTRQREVSAVKLKTLESIKAKLSTVTEADAKEDAKAEPNPDLLGAVETTSKPS